MDYGVVVLGVVLMALFMFWGAEKVEAAMGGDSARKAPRRAAPAAALLVALAVVALLVGQPDNADRWRMIEAEQSVLLEQREVQIEPAELLGLTQDTLIKAVMIDVRDERHFNQFHIHDARLVPMDGLIEASESLMQEPPNTGWIWDLRRSEITYLYPEALHPILMTLIFAGLAWWLHRGWKMPVMIAVGLLFIINQEDVFTTSRDRFDRF